MAYDSITTAAVATDMEQRLVGSYIDKIIGPSEQTIGLLFWTGRTNHWVLFSAHPQHARVVPTAQRLSGGGAEPSSFVMLLRKHLDGQRVNNITQSGCDRVLTFQIGSAGVTLIAEIMGKNSNIILVDGAGIILGSLKRVTAAMNRYREVMTHRTYVPPPQPSRPGPTGDPIPKLDPRTCLAGDLAAALHGQPPNQRLWQALIDCLDGCSPQLAREIVARWQLTMPANTTPGDISPPTASTAATLEHSSALLAIVRALYQPEDDRWQPSVAWRADQIAAWAVYPLRQYEGDAAIDVRPSHSLEEMFDLVYGGDEVGDELAEPLDAQRKPLLAALDAQRERVRHKVTSLRDGLPDPATITALREKGQLLLAYGHTLTPDQSVLHVEDPPLDIAVDPSLSPVENAQAYFRRYTKTRDAAQKVPALLEAAEAERDFLDQARVFVELAHSPSDLAQVRSDLHEAGVPIGGAAPVRKPAKQPKNVKGRKQAPTGKSSKANAATQAIMRVRSADGTEILVGRSASQNDLVTFSLAGSGDVWLHAREIPGAHVIVKSGGRPPSAATLHQAAELAASYSRGRDATSVPVDYTFVRYVRRIKGAGPGLVHYSGETTLMVRPQPAEAH